MHIAICCSPATTPGSRRPYLSASFSCSSFAPMSPNFCRCPGLLLACVQRSSKSSNTCVHSDNPWSVSLRRDTGRQLTWRRGLNSCGISGTGAGTGTRAGAGTLGLEVSATAMGGAGKVMGATASICALFCPSGGGSFQAGAGATD